MSERPYASDAALTRTKAAQDHISLLKGDLKVLGATIEATGPSKQSCTYARMRRIFAEA